MKDILKGIVCAIALVGLGACQPGITLKHEVKQECVRIAQASVCEATQAHWVIGKLQAKINQAHAEKRINDEKHKEISLALRQATGHTIAYESGGDTFGSALNLIEETFNYLVGLGFSKHTILN